MSGHEFNTAKGRSSGPANGGSPLALYRPHIVVAALVVMVLLGGALYASRISEGAPEVVYSTSLEEVAEDSQTSLAVNLNTAEAGDLEELPGVGPVTAEKIVDHRRSNGLFRSVEELEEVSGIGPKTLEQIRPLAEV